MAHRLNGLQETASAGKTTISTPISWQGSSYLIEFAYSTEWEYNVSDWAQVLTKSYVVYIPEDYNGLIFAAEAQPLTYKEKCQTHAARQHLSGGGHYGHRYLRPLQLPVFRSLRLRGGAAMDKKRSAFAAPDAGRMTDAELSKAARRPPEAVCRLASGGAGRRNERYRLLFYGAGCIAQGDPCDGAVFGGVCCAVVFGGGAQKAESADARAAGRLFSASLALETDYAFAAVAGSVDLRDLDAVRRSYIRSLQEMCCVLDQLKASPALTGAAE